MKTPIKLILVSILFSYCCKPEKYESMTRERLIGTWVGVVVFESSMTFEYDSLFECENNKISDSALEYKVIPYTAYEYVEFTFYEDSIRIRDEMFDNTSKYSLKNDTISVFHHNKNYEFIYSIISLDNNSLTLIINDNDENIENEIILKKFASDFFYEDTSSYYNPFYLRKYNFLINSDICDYDELLRIFDIVGHDSWEVEEEIIPIKPINKEI